MDSPAKPPDRYHGLKSSIAHAFPRCCPRCGRRFTTAVEFICNTQALRAGTSGLKSVRDESNRPVLELFRNCPCGSTLMDRFDDRRDLSAPGLRRRERFGRLLHLLENRGIPAGAARVELLKLLGGEPSAILADLGITSEDLR